MMNLTSLHGDSDWLAGLGEVSRDFLLCTLDVQRYVR